MTKTPKWLPDGSGIDTDSLPNEGVLVETEHGERMTIDDYAWTDHPAIVRVYADVTPPKPDPRRSALVAELLAALPGSALSRSGADVLADTLLAALDAMGADQ